MNRVLRLLIFAAASGLAAATAFGVAFFGGKALWPEAAVAPWMALLLLLSAPLLGRVGRWALGPRGAVAAALATALVAPMILLGALSELSEPLVYGTPPFCGTGRLMMEMSVPPGMFVAGALGALLAAGFVARGARRFHRVLLGLVAISVILSGASLLRARHLPETDGYVGSLPIVATLRATQGTPVFHAEAPDQLKPMGRADLWSGPVDVYDDAIEGAVLRRACAAHDCQVSLVIPGTPPENVSFHRWDVRDDGTLEVRRDRARGIWVVISGGRHAYLGPDLHRGDVSVQDAGSSLSPPRDWIGGAAFGLLFAAVLLPLRRRAARRRAAIAAGREGTLEPSGLVTLASADHPLRVAPGQALAVGPVVVLHAPVVPGGVYRGDGLLVGALVACGTREDLLAAAEAKIAWLDALGISAIALTVAPLMASAMMGIVL